MYNSFDAVKSSIFKFSDQQLLKVYQNLKDKNIEESVLKECFPYRLFNNGVQTSTSKRIVDPILIMNYTSKSHALFGDFAKKYLNFKNGFLLPTQWLKPKANLAFGFGWIIIDTSKVSVLQSEMKKRDIPVRIVERSAYEDELKVDNQETDVQDIEQSQPDDEESMSEELPRLLGNKEKTSKPKDDPKEKTSKPKDDPKEKTSNPAKKLNISKNDYGNHEECNTGFVFKKLPLGKNSTPVVIGYQDKESDMTGLDSVLPLDDEQQEVCKDKKWRYLTMDMVEELMTTSKDVAEKLKEILETEFEEISEEDE